MVDAFLNKKYKLVKSTNFNQYLKAIGVELVVRKIGNFLSPIIELQKSSDEYILTSYSTYNTVVVKFKPGIETTHNLTLGLASKSVFFIEGSTIIEKLLLPNGKISIIERKFADKELKVICHVDKIVSTRVYKALP